jgi:hypothetical protein
MHEQVSEFIDVMFMLWGNFTLLTVLVGIDDRLFGVWAWRVQEGQ